MTMHLEGSRSTVTPFEHFEAQLRLVVYILEWRRYSIGLYKIPELNATDARFYIESLDTSGTRIVPTLIISRVVAQALLDLGYTTLAEDNFCMKRTRKRWDQREFEQYAAQSEAWK